MRGLTVIVALALQASLVGCATSTEQIVICPPGKELNADGTDCVPIRCIGDLPPKFVHS